jgi:hypothetical protein
MFTKLAQTVWDEAVAKLQPLAVDVSPAQIIQAASGLGFAACPDERGAKVTSGEISVRFPEYPQLLYSVERTPDGLKVRKRLTGIHNDNRDEAQEVLAALLPVLAEAVNVQLETEQALSERLMTLPVPSWVRGDGLLRAQIMTVPEARAAWADFIKNIMS